MDQRNSEKEVVTSTQETYTEGFSVGSVVWAKFGKTRWWPGLVIAGTMVEQETKQGHVWIYWILDGRVSQVRYKDLDPFTKNLVRRMRSPTCSKMKLAIQKTLKLLAERTQTDVSRFDNIEERVTEPGCFFHVKRENPEQTAAHQEISLPDFVIEEFKKIGEGKQSKGVQPLKRKYQDTL